MYYLFDNTNDKIDISGLYFFLTNRRSHLASFPKVMEKRLYQECV